MLLRQTALRAPFAVNVPASRRLPSTVGCKPAPSSNAIASSGSGGRTDAARTKVAKRAARSCMRYLRGRSPRLRWEAGASDPFQFEVAVKLIALSIAAAAAESATTTSHEYEPVEA